MIDGRAASLGFVPRAASCELVERCRRHLVQESGSGAALDLLGISRHFSV